MNEDLTLQGVVAWDAYGPFDMGTYVATIGVPKTQCTLRSSGRTPQTATNRLVHGLRECGIVNKLVVYKAQNGPRARETTYTYEKGSMHVEPRKVR